MSKYAITIDLPTAKPTVEVAGLGVFPNHETTELTDEQVWHWFNRVGAEPLAQFQEGITISEVQPKVTSASSKKTKPAAKSDSESESEQVKETAADESPSEKTEG